MTKSEYISKLESEFKEMNTEFDEIVALCRDEKYAEFGFLKPIGELVKAIHMRFQHHEDIILNIISNTSFKAE